MHNGDRLAAESLGTRVCHKTGGSKRTASIHGYYFLDAGFNQYGMPQQEAHQTLV